MGVLDFSETRLEHMNDLTKRLGTFYATAKTVTIKDLIDILSEYGLDAEINSLQVSSNLIKKLGEPIKNTTKVSFEVECE